MLESLATGERQASADEHHTALFSVMAEFDQAVTRPKRRAHWR